MSYRWVPQTGSFSVQELESADLMHDFDDQGSAEDWLGLFYTDLLNRGVAEVSLFEEDRLVYGPMPLTP